MSSLSEQQRLRELEKEIHQLERLAEYNPRWLAVKREGKGRVMLQLVVPSYVQGKGRSVTLSNEHTVHFTFSSDYLSTSRLTIDIDHPVPFHPNLIPSGHWGVTGHLQEAASYIWERFTFQSVDLNTDKVRNPAAVQWYLQENPSPTLLEKLVIPPEPRENAESVSGSDKIDTLTDERKQATASETSRRSTDPADSVTMQPQSGEKRAPSESLPDAAQRTSDVLSSQGAPSLGRLPHQLPSLPSLSPSSSLRHEERFVAPVGREAHSQGFKPKLLRHHLPQEWPIPWDSRELQTGNGYNGWTYDMTRSGYGGRSSLNVIIHQPALERIFFHAAGDTRNERFGILIGGVFTDPIRAENWVEIIDMLPAERVRANITSVEVSAEEINRLNTEIDEILAQTEEQVRKIGWYHTHPGHGIFMSGTDQTNQRLCYSAQWQVALVVDPIHKQYGAFSGPECIPIISAPKMLSQANAQRFSTPAYQLWQTVKSGQYEPNEMGGPRADSGLSQNNWIDTPPNGALTYPVGPPLEPRVENPQELTRPQQPPSERRSVKDGLKAARTSLSSGSFSRIILISSVLVNIVLAGIFVYEINFYGNIVEHDRQQLVSQTQQLAAEQNTQQMLLEQATSIQGVDALAYRQILHAVVLLNRTSHQGQAAISLLKADIQYTVMQGDTLSGIAQKFNVSLGALYQNNPTLDPANPNHVDIQAGNVITIPGETSP